MSKKIYQRFVPVEDHLSTISAEDVNELKAAVENLQEQTFIQEDLLFTDRCVMALANHPEANALVVDTLDEQDVGLTYHLRNLTYHQEMRGMVLDIGQASGSLTVEIPSPTGKVIRLPVILAEEYRPQGTTTRWEVSYDNETFHPVRINEALPPNLQGERSILFVRFTMTRTAADQEPRLDAFALLYKDETYAFKFLDDGLDIGVESLWDGTIVE